MEKLEQLPVSKKLAERVTLGRERREDEERRHRRRMEFIKETKELLPYLANMLIKLGAYTLSIFLLIYAVHLSGKGQKDDARNVYSTASALGTAAVCIRRNPFKKEEE